MMIPSPYLLFLGDAQDSLAIKVAQGVVDWRLECCLGQLRLPGCLADVGLEDITIQQAKTKGAQTMVIGIVNAGGTLANHWIPTICQALEAGLNVASGLHVPLALIPEINQAAHRFGSTIYDLRHSNVKFKTGNGKKRKGKRLLTIGTDCAVGKKYTALCLARDMRTSGLKATFRPTGQSGILIAGQGIAIDAVVADFIAGAAEHLSPDNDANHWDIIEGQGSLFHPSFSGVTLGLLHGSQPDAFVVCHEPTRTRMRGVDLPVPSIEKIITATRCLGQLTNPNIQCVGISINTRNLDEASAKQLINETAENYKLPCTDSMRFGTNTVIQTIIQQFGGMSAW